ncbi:MAG: DUF3108 domain-containing protein [Deltaproteobacteria bacterium]|nr:DUF3108 domain-containing protein [Deltaproteobacteria bacterium]
MMQGVNSRKGLFMKMLNLLVFLIIPSLLWAEEGAVIKLQKKLSKGKDREISKKVKKCTKEKIQKITIPYSDNELLYYIVALKDIPIGKVYLKIMKEDDKENTTHFKIVSKAKTNSFFSKVYKVNAYFKDEFSLPDFSNISFYEDVTEKEIRRKTTYNFSKDGSVTTDTEKDGNKESKKYTGGDHTMDFLTLMYMIRGLPLEKGKSYCFEVFYHKYFWEVSGAVKGKERIQTPAGFYNSIYIEGIAQRKDKPSVIKKLRIWISDDDKRVVLKGETMMNMGEVTGYLAYIKSGKQIKNEEIIIDDEDDSSE